MTLVPRSFAAVTACKSTTAMPGNASLSGRRILSCARAAMEPLQTGCASGSHPCATRVNPFYWCNPGARWVGALMLPAATNHRLHPNIDESRNLLVQDLLYSGGLAQLGYVGGVGVVPRTLPENTDSATRYHTDGLRAVLFFVTRPLTLSDIEILDWVPMLQQREAEAAAKNPDQQPGE